MSRRDSYHKIVRQALVDEGWDITSVLLKSCYLSTHSHHHLGRKQNCFLMMSGWAML
ncbi:MAG: hypothetical protein DYG89_36600 [Caldilinea sp. CFX5]|nr:hypothetical protein [Caldilinea sp. CFX5]